MSAPENPIRAKPPEPEPEPARKPAPQIVPPSVLDRALRGLRAALPIVQKVLPLLEGQVLTAASNLLAPHVSQRPVDLAPLENGLADLRARHAELSNRMAEQSQAFKRVAERLEDRLNQVQAAADRNSLEQKELRESLVSAGRKATVVAILALGLLAVSVAANLFLFLHFQRILR